MKKLDIFSLDQGLIYIRRFQIFRKIRKTRNSLGIFLAAEVELFTDIFTINRELDTF